MNDPHDVAILMNLHAWHHPLTEKALGMVTFDKQGALKVDRTRVATSRVAPHWFARVIGQIDF